MSRSGRRGFVILQKLSDNSWQLQNTATGEWCKFTEDDLLDRFTRNELVFDRSVGDQPSGDHRSSAQLDHALSAYPLELVAIAQNRVAVSEGDRPAAAYCDHRDNHGAAHTVWSRSESTTPSHRLAHAGRDYGKWLVRAATSGPLSRGTPIGAAAALAWFQRSKPSAIR